MKHQMIYIITMLNSIPQENNRASIYTRSKYHSMFISR